MATCAGIKADGGRCKAQAILNSEWCFNHHPDYEDERRQRAAKGGRRGGRGRPAVEVSELKGQLSDLYASVLDGQVEPKVGAVAAQIANVRARLVETELKVKEQEEMIARIEELELLMDQQRQGRRGA